MQGQDGGKTEGYWFAVIGTAGETAEHDCVGDKSKGSTGSCTFEDKAEIGEVTGVRIGNGFNDNWRFTKMSLSVDGVAQPTFYGYASVEAFQTINVAFDKGLV